MVAVAVLLTIVGLLLVDLLVQYVQSRASRPDVPTGPLPELPTGLFFHPNHCWAQLEPTGAWRVGVDALIGQLVGRVDSITLPEPGTRVMEGEPLATLLQGPNRLVVRSPVTGEVMQSNRSMRPESLDESPYADGWLCIIRPEKLAEDTRRLSVGADALKWQSREAARLADFFGELPGLAQAREVIARAGLMGLGAAMQKLGDPEWRRFQKAFLDSTG